MNKYLPYVLLAVIVCVQAFDKGLIDFVPSPVSGEHKIVAAYKKSLSADFAEIADGVDESQGSTLDATIANAFRRAANASDATISSDIDSLADDDFEGLKDLFRKLSEELK